MINKDFQLFLKKNKLKKNTNIILEASFESLQASFDSPNDVIETLVDFFSAGNLIIPAFTNQSIKNNDTFDLSTKTDLDCVHEAAISYKNSFRTIHPTHSFCILGNERLKYGTKHVKARTPLNKKSPVSLISSGKILFLGASLNQNAYMCYLEELNKVPYLFNDSITRYFINNKSIKYKSYYKEAYGFKPEFQKIINILNLKACFFNDLEVYIIDIKQMKNQVTKIMKENPFYFVSKK